MYRRLSLHLRSVIIWLWIALPCSVSAAPLTLPPGIPALPELQNVDQKGILVGKENLESFEKLIAEELRPLIRNGEFLLEAALITPDLPALSADWLQNSSGSLVAADAIETPWDRKKFPPRGFIFSPRTLPQGSQPVLGHVLLWNTFTHFWSTDNFRADFSLFLVKKNNRARKLGIRVERVFPPQLGKGTIPQVFREKISLISPAILAGYTWLSFRFVGAEEDAVWVQSAAIRKVRQLTGTNRGDDFFRGAFAPDDLFVASGKPENVIVKSTTSEILFVPFHRNGRRSLTQQGGSSCVKSDPEMKALGSWNFESDYFKAMAPGIPTDSVFVPRNVFRIEYVSKDPFAVNAREVIYVDQELNLPFLKVSLSRVGETRKLVIGSIAAVDFPSDDPVNVRTLPLVAGTSLFSATGENAFLSLTKFEACPGQTTPAELESFDPSALEPAPATPTIAPVKTATPRSESDAEPKSRPTSTTDAPVEAND